MRRLLPLLLALSACATAPKQAPPAPDEPVVLTLPRPAGGEWLGLYLLGQKAGWLYADHVADSFEGRPAVRAELQMLLEVAVGGNVARRQVIDRRWYERAPGGPLLGFEAIRTGDGGDRHGVGRCDGARCEVVVRHERGVERRSVAQPPETADDADPVRLALASRGTVDSVWLDLDELQLHRTGHRFDGNDGGGGRIVSREAGEEMDMVTLLASDGRTLEVQLAPGLVARAEPEARARVIGVPAEIFTLTRVELPTPLPRAPARLVLVMEGLPEPLWRSDGRQRFEALEDGAVRISIDAAASRPGAAEAAHVEATASVDHDHPAVRALALSLWEEAGPTPAVLAGALVDHVYRRLEKAYGVSSDRASRVLAEGRGDCTEHALLFVALARAAGLPARTVHGLVHAELQGPPALYWHEWAEVWLDGAWVAVDPTFGQMPADATHLALGEGRSTASAHAVGQLRIRSVEAR